ncbi:MAG: hypothetical protein ACRCYS_04155 [Beijerinckiaceae bacterium]
MKDIVAIIDKAVVNASREEPRGYLGASQLGDRCVRKLWYAFHWAYQEKHLGRTLRLFNRGHEEEGRFVRFLRLAGAEVRDYSQRLCYHSGSDSYATFDWDEELPEDPINFVDDVSDDPLHVKRAAALGQGVKQWGFVDIDGHFAGNCDGKIRWEGVLPDGWGLAEFKTHNDKSFKALTAKGVLTSKPTHYVQMQVYMHYLGLPWALYMAVNKDNDELYLEIVYYKAELALSYVDRARGIIYAKDAPPRLTNDPSWFECRYCPNREICHYEDSPQKNCRSCAFSAPIETGEWRCHNYHQDIPRSFMLKGCDAWQGIK